MMKKQGTRREKLGKEKSQGEGVEGEEVGHGEKVHSAECVKTTLRFPFSTM